MRFRHIPGLNRVHFVGIGGAGMSGIAELLLDYDLEVSGSDAVASEATERLARLGATVVVGHAASHVAGADLVVISSAIADANPEVIAARELGVTVVRRAEMLAELMRLKYGIAVAGTHGKTTTTSLIGTLLSDASLDPTVLVGGRLRLTGTGARHGSGDFLVAEADEYDRSFLQLAPVLAVVTSIDVDHLDTYKDLEDIQDAFVEFASRVPFFGRVIACIDDPNVAVLLPRLTQRRVCTYGLSRRADVRALDVRATETGSEFGVQVGGRLQGRVELSLPGEHNVRNALAAVAVGHTLGVEFEVIRSSLSGFAGVHRRFERLGRWRGAEIVDDYAHHPTEVSATLGAARQVFGKGEIHAVFQPHLYSRTRDLASQFGRALMEADHAVVTAIYPSRERPIPGVSAELVVNAARHHGHRRIQSCADWRDVPELLAAEVQDGDAIFTLGAGDIYQLARLLAAEGSG